MRANVSMCCIALLGLVSVVGGIAQAQTDILVEDWAGLTVADSFGQGATGTVTPTTSGLTWDVEVGANGGLLDFTGEQANISVVGAGGTPNQAIVTTTLASGANFGNGDTVTLQARFELIQGGNGTNSSNTWIVLGDGVGGVNANPDNRVQINVNLDTDQGNYITVTESGDGGSDNFATGVSGVPEIGHTVLVTAVYTPNGGFLDKELTVFDETDSVELYNVFQDGATAGVPLPLGTLNVARVVFTVRGQSSVDDFKITVTSPPPPVGPTPPIVPSSIFAVADTTFTLSAALGGTGYQWTLGGVDIIDGGNISGASGAVLVFDTVQLGDEGLYGVSYDDGSPKATINLTYFLEVFPSGTSIPVAGLLGLGLLASACVMGGASVLRRKK